MAAGKTTFGRALARALGREFIDLDFYIEQRFRKSVRRIFEEKGEGEFRRMEREMLREVGDFENTVVSCGGGTPCFEGNMEYMKSRGLVVWLEASVDCICRRALLNNRRPLLAGKSKEEVRCVVERGLAEREKHYCEADISFSGEELENKREIAKTVEKFLETLKHHSPEGGQ